MDRNIRAGFAPIPCCKRHAFSTANDVLSMLEIVSCTARIHTVFSIAWRKDPSGGRKITHMLTSVFDNYCFESEKQVNHEDNIAAIDSLYFRFDL